jgi:hypothetical protein
MFTAGQAGAQPACGRQARYAPTRELSLKALLAVADAVDYADAVVGNEQ